MNQEQFRRVAEIDSRRVATGLICRIIRDAANNESSDNKRLNGLLSHLKKHGYFPPTLVEIPPEKGIHTATGIAFVVPTSALEFVAQEVKELNLVSKREDTAYKQALLHQYFTRRDVQGLDYEINEPLTPAQVLNLKHTDPLGYEQWIQHGTSAGPQIKTRLEQFVLDTELRQHMAEREILDNIQEDIFMVTVDVELTPKASGAEYDVYLQSREQPESLAFLIRRGTLKKGEPSWVKDQQRDEASLKRWRELQRDAAEKFKASIKEQERTELDEHSNPYPDPNPLPFPDQLRDPYPDWTIPGSTGP